MFFSRCGRQAAEGEKQRFCPEVRILLSTPEGRDGGFATEKCAKNWSASTFSFARTVWAFLKKSPTQTVWAKVSKIVWKDHLSCSGKDQTNLRSLDIENF